MLQYFIEWIIRFWPQKKLINGIYVWEVFDIPKNIVLYTIY